MSWIEVCLHGTHEAVDWVNTLLATVNYQGDVQITNYDESAQHAVDRPSGSPSWQFTIHLYLPNTAAAGAQVEEIERLFSPLHRTNMTTLPQISVLAEKPNAVLSESHPHHIGQHFVILPNDDAKDYADRLQPSDIPLYLATTRAFGSGLHPTTIVSLKLLERHVVSGMHTLDFGCGSGILSVAMTRLGATVLALDNDPVAVAATQDTVECNGMQSQVTVARGSLGAGSEMGHWMGGELGDAVPQIETRASFDLVVANILSRIHLALVDEFSNALHSPGLLIAAGFTADYATEIAAALTSAGFEAIDREQLDEWVGLAFRKQC